MSLGDFIKTTPAPTVLTLEALQKTFDQIANMPPHPCSLGKHVVSATALREGWKYARCGNCYGVVQLHTNQPKGE